MMEVEHDNAVTIENGKFVPASRWWTIEKGSFTQFIKKLLRLGEIDSCDYDLELGKHYNIPRCCIDNYIYLSKQGIMVHKYMAKKYGYDKHKHVRCAKCRRIK